MEALQIPSFFAFSPYNLNVTALFEPVIYTISSILLLGSCVVGFSGSCRVQYSDILKGGVDAFIASEEPIALEKLLCNIGSSGCAVSGAKAGLVIASPSKSSPDYFYTWTRDAALVFKAVVDQFLEGYDADLQAEIQNYIIAQAKLQGVVDPSGDLSDGGGLGEPKFNADGTAFTGSWGRPQRDGPALRAVAMIAYSNWLIANGYSTTVTSVVWPIIKNDLSYVTQYWNATGFDLWEEVQGSSFFTVANQHRALIEGNTLATQLDLQCVGCISQAAQILCFQQSFWSASGNYMVANINGGSDRTGKDANTILASISTFDIEADCDAATFQPCSDKALANHKAVTDSFRKIYKVNHDIARGDAVSVGRYAEDVYYNGNPWYLNTLAAAEQLYDALYTWNKTGSIEVTSISLAFFQDFNSSILVSTYSSNTDTYKSLYQKIKTYADGYVLVVQKYIGPNGTMAEQFNRNDGSPLSASDLTWSYASFLTMAKARAGIMPPSWGASGANTLPETCQATGISGTYTSATLTSFPTSQTPNHGSTTSTKTTQTTTTTSKSTSTTATCTPVPSVAVGFRVLKTTVYGETVKLTGSITELGSWDPSQALALSADGYTQDNPVWTAKVTLAAGEKVQYKFIIFDRQGAVIWEADPNREFMVSVGCAASMVVNGTWQESRDAVEL